MTSNQHSMRPEYALAILRDQVAKADEGRGPDDPWERALLTHIDRLEEQLEARPDWPKEVHEQYLAVLSERDALQEQLESAQRKVEAYDRARARVKIEGATRAEYVLLAESALEQLESLRLEARDWETSARVESDGLMRWRDRAKVLEEQLEATQKRLDEVLPVGWQALLDMYEKSIGDLNEQLEALRGATQAAAVLLRYPASADGPGDEFVQECRAWLDGYDSNQESSPASEPEASDADS